TVSAERGRWGPWASVAPMGRMATGRSFIASSTSVHVISDITMFSAMAIEGRLPSLLSEIECLGDKALLQGRGSGRAQAPPVDLTPVVLGQGGRELHDARVLERREAALHEVLQLPRQAIVAGNVS